MWAKQTILSGASSSIKMGKGVNTQDRRLPVHLVWFEEFQTRAEAIETEARIKSWSRKKKEALVRDDFDTIREAAKKDFTHKAESGSAIE